MRLTVLTYNVHKCVGGLDRRYRPERVVETAAHHAPDIVLLQECGNGTETGPRWHRQVDVLADGLGLGHRAWFPNHRYRRGGEYGNAVLSRWPIHDVENVDLTVPGRKKRSVLHARVMASTEGGHHRTVHVFNMHLGLREDTRKKQLAAFVACRPFARLRRSTPIVVGGDLNDVFGTLGPRHFVPAGFRTGRRVRTFPAWAPFQALDAIYVRGDVELLHLARSRLAAARQASDHLPLVAELELRPPTD